MSALIGLTQTCAFEVYARSANYMESSLFLGPGIPDSGRLGLFRQNWTALARALEEHVLQASEAELRQAVQSVLELRLTITALPKKRHPVHGVHGVRYVIARRARLVLGGAKGHRFEYQGVGPEPWVVLSCVPQARGDRAFAGPRHSCVGVKEATLIRRLEQPAANGLGAVASDFQGLAEHHAEVAAEGAGGPDRPIQIEGDPAKAFERAHKAIEAWLKEPEPDPAQDMADPLKRPRRKRGHGRVIRSVSTTRSFAR